MKMETFVGAQPTVTQDPSDADLLLAISQVYAHSNEAIILDDDSSHHFLQMAGDGLCQTCVTPNGPLYSASGITPEQAGKLFLSFAQGNDAWRTAVSWHTETADLPPQIGRAQVQGVIARPTDWEQAWRAARTEYRLQPH